MAAASGVSGRECWNRRLKYGQGDALHKAVGHVRHLGLYLRINECHLKVYKEIGKKNIYIPLTIRCL